MGARRSASARRRVLLIREPIGHCVVEEVAERLSAIATVYAAWDDGCADVAYITMETDASEYTIRGLAPGFRIWRGAAPLTASSGNDTLSIVRDSVSSGRPATGVN